MAKKKNKKNQGNWLHRLRRKFRVVVVNLETFEEKRHFVMSPMNMLVLIVFSLFVVSTLTYVLIAFTPIKRLVPGYPGYAEEQKLLEQDKKNLNYLEELQAQSSIEALYFKNLEAILQDRVPLDPTQDSSFVMDSVNLEQVSFNISKEDSLLRVKVDEREKFALSGGLIGGPQNEDLKGVFLFAPIKGTVSGKMNTTEGHYGVDVAAPKDEAVNAVLEGTVVFTDWTPENGHVIHVQHNHNLLSVYKHNSFILKKVGDAVEAGEPIAIIGNSGELTTGTHLHFELWYKGKALDPEEFIAF